MTGNVLVDTNAIVYAYDRSEPDKQLQALRVLDALSNARVLTVSTQILAEFFVTVTRKIPSPLSAAEAVGRLEVFVRGWTILDVTSLVILEAARGARDHQFSFWDAQIWAVARINQIVTVFSEDFNAGSVIEAVQLVNPFAADFRVSDWAV